MCVSIYKKKMLVFVSFFFEVYNMKLVYVVKGFSSEIFPFFALSFLNKKNVEFPFSLKFSQLVCTRLHIKYIF